MQEGTYLEGGDEVAETTLRRGQGRIQRAGGRGGYEYQVGILCMGKSITLITLK